jgi:adenylate cyclase
LAMAITVSGVVGVVLGLLLASLLLEPLSVVEDAVMTVGCGDLAIELAVIGGNEIGRLGASFNEMVRGMREREQMKSFVSSAVLEAVSADRSSDLEHRGHAREVTVVFSKIRNFAIRLEQEEPAAVLTMLDELLAGFDRCIRAFGGEVDKFIGDAVMAVFRYPGHPLAAARAALAMQDFVATFSRSREERGLTPVRIGIGVNSGLVMMGAIGSSLRRDLTVIGDAVNLAARLEGLACHGRYTSIVISSSTRDQVQAAIQVVELPVTKVKGRFEMVRVFEIIGIGTGVTG